MLFNNLLLATIQGRIQGEVGGGGLVVNPPFFEKNFNLLGFFKKKCQSPPS